MTVSTTCPIPSSINPLSPTGFKLSITKLPEIEFFTQEVTLPDITLGSIAVGTPFSMSGVPGDTLNFGDFTINFLVDENMDNYLALYNWLIGLGFPESYSQYQNFAATQGTAQNLDPRLGQNVLNYSDATLSILGNNNVPIRSVKFVDLHPVGLGALNFVANASDITYLVGNAIFRYTYYSVE
jgi:hypothetical protein